MDYYTNELRTTNPWDNLIHRIYLRDFVRRSFRLRPLKSDCFDQLGGPLPRSERYDYVRSFAGFDPFAGADSDSWTSRVMSSSLDSVVHVWEAVALDSSNSSIRLCVDRDVVESLESSVYTL